MFLLASVLFRAEVFYFCTYKKIILALKNRKLTDIGFGEKDNTSTTRLINNNGRFNVRRTGKPVWNLYAEFLEITWAKFYLLIIIFYVALNLFFAFLFTLMGPDALSGVSNQDFYGRYLDCFFFSIQTFTTVGYGSMSPASLPANILSALIAMVGLLVIAMITGIFFARLSKPIAYIRFSEKILLAPYRDGKGLMFRMVNMRDTVISDVKITVLLTRLYFQNGEERREYLSLDLERDSVNLFPLNWTIVHPVNDSSPLLGIKKEQLAEQHAEILIDLKGYDETFNQIVRIRNSYKLEEMMENKKFSKMFYTSPDGKIILETDGLDRLEDGV